MVAIDTQEIGEAIDDITIDRYGILNKSSWGSLEQWRKRKATNVEVCGYQFLKCVRWSFQLLMFETIWENGVLADTNDNDDNRTDDNQFVYNNKEETQDIRFVYNNEEETQDTWSQPISTDMCAYDHEDTQEDEEDADTDHEDPEEFEFQYPEDQLLIFKGGTECISPRSQSCKPTLIGTTTTRPDLKNGKQKQQD